jgi:hypothetical protein
MIANDIELQVTLERIALFQRRVLGFRQKARPEEFESLTGFYSYELEKMHAEVMDYLLRPLETSDAETATPSVTTS